MLQKNDFYNLPLNYLEKKKTSFGVQYMKNSVFLVSYGTPSNESIPVCR